MARVTPESLGTGDPAGSAPRRPGRTTIRQLIWNKYAAVTALALVTAGLTAFVVTRPTHTPVGTHVADNPHLDAAPSSRAATATLALGPLGLALQDEIKQALAATGWPVLEPSMASVISNGQQNRDVDHCGQVENPDPSLCTWGSSTAAKKVVIVGDSVAMTYANVLRNIALMSPDKLQVRTEAMYDCPFIDDRTATEDPTVEDACPGRKQHAIDVINESKPDIVIISNSYGRTHIVDKGEMTPMDWKNSLGRAAERIRGNTRKIVLLSPPPADVTIAECYANSKSKPADCISAVTNRWRSRAALEQQVATSVGGTWIDSRPWFCNQGRQCPSFVGSTPTKYDWALMTPAYANKIAPVVDETLHTAGIM